MNGGGGGCAEGSAEASSERGIDAAGFELVTLQSGARSLRSRERGETFHPVTGPWVEANRLHVEQTRLRERAAAWAAGPGGPAAPGGPSRHFVVWDVGFGAAANAIAAVEALRDSPGPVEVHSFDKTRASIEFALEHAGELDYLAGYEAAAAELAREGSAGIGERVRWRLHLGDFALGVSTPSLPAPHAILYDPYSPATNPEMWTLPHFERLFARLDPSVPCLWTNYTRATPVRVALLLAGFHVGRGCSVGGGAMGGDKETTVASNRPELLERPLDARWLERVRKSYGSAPLRAAVYTQTPISPEDWAALLRHPQFAGL